MLEKKQLATKLHDHLCPKCNGRCSLGSPCVFTHTPEESDWETNSANSFFLQLANKGLKIMEETHITEEQLVMYANYSRTSPEDIPDIVYASMCNHEFI